MIFVKDLRIYTLNLIDFRKIRLHILRNTLIVFGLEITTIDVVNPY